MRPWQTGDLTWNDFRVVDTNTVKEHSYIEFYLDIEENEEYELGTSWVELVAAAYMDKKLSWVDKKHCTAEELRYNQVIFDLVELFRRRLQVVIDTGGNADIDYYIRLLEHVTDSFCRDTRYGANTLAVVAWETKVGKQLDSIAPIVMQKHATSHPSKRNYMPRAWEKGPLGWNNFTLVTESIGEEHSYLEYSLDIENRKYENDGVTWWGKTAVANMDKNSTWVDKNHCTAAELRYNQVLFNIVELYRRHLQVDIDTGGKADRDYFMQLLNQETARYCSDTRFGAATTVTWHTPSSVLSNPTAMVALPLRSAVMTPSASTVATLVLSLLYFSAWPAVTAMAEMSNLQVSPLPSFTLEDGVWPKLSAPATTEIPITDAISSASATTRAIQRYFIVDSSHVSHNMCCHYKPGTHGKQGHR